MKNERMGIIGCNSLADEIAYLLHRDQTISRIFIVANPEGSTFIERKVRGPIVERTAIVPAGELGSIEPAPGFEVVLWLLSSSLHESPSLLNTVITETATRLSRDVDSIFVVHGLCGIAEHQVRSNMERLAIPINFLRYDDGQIADDCFGSFIGSKERYLDFIKKNKFALFVTTGFAEYLKVKHENEDVIAMVKNIEELRFTLETLGFKKIIKLDAGVGDVEEFDRIVNIFSRTLNLEIESIKCDLSVFDRSYDFGKNSIQREMPLSTNGDSSRC